MKRPFSEPSTSVLVVIGSVPGLAGTLSRIEPTNMEPIDAQPSADGR